MTRIGLLVAIASCANVPKDDTLANKREIVREDEADEDDEEWQPLTGPIGDVAPATCSPQPHTTRAGITLVWSNATKFEYDFCRATDQALGRVPNLARLAAIQFEMVVFLPQLEHNGPDVRCQIDVALEARGIAIDDISKDMFVSGSSKRRGEMHAAARQCIDGVLGEVIQGKAARAMQMYALSRRHDRAR